MEVPPRLSLRAFKASRSTLLSIKFLNNHMAPGLLVLSLLFLTGCGDGDGGNGGGGSNTAPQIISAPEIFAKENTAYIYKVSAIDDEGDPLTFSLTTAPSGMEINPGTGTISWIPTSSQGGEHTVEIQASDGKASGSQDYTVAVETSTVIASEFIVAGTGGTVEVTDPNSPILGAKVEIPPQVLPQDATITISSASFPNYLPETVPVIEIRGNLPTQQITEKSSNSEGPQFAPIPAHTTIIIPFPPAGGSTNDGDLKLYRSSYVVFCQGTNIKQPKEDPFYCGNHGYDIEVRRVWEEVDPSEYSKDTTNRIFTYFLEETETADSL